MNRETSFYAFIALLFCVVGSTSAFAAVITGGQVLRGNFEDNTTFLFAIYLIGVWISRGIVLDSLDDMAEANNLSAGA